MILKSCMSSERQIHNYIHFCSTQGVIDKPTVYALNGWITVSVKLNASITYQDE